MNGSENLRGDAKRAICFVCLGNICRSPTAAAIMEHLVREAGLSRQIQIESAGTSDWNEGCPPDARSVAEATRRGLQMRGTAQPFRAVDLERFDYVLGMDRGNLGELRALAGSGRPRAWIGLLREFDPASPPGSEIPDPYRAGPEGFARVFELCEAACRGLLAEIRVELAAEARGRGSPTVRQP